MQPKPNASSGRAFRIEGPDGQAINLTRQEVKLVAQQGASLQLASLLDGTEEAFSVLQSMVTEIRKTEAALAPERPQNRGF